MSEFKSQVYVYVVQQTEDYSLQDIVENTAVYRQAAQFHLKRLVEIGAVEKVSYGRYKTIDTQKIFDAMVVVSVEKLKPVWLMKSGFELSFPMYLNLLKYADRLGLSLMTKQARKAIRRDLTQAEKNIRTARVLLNNKEAMTTLEAKELRDKGDSEQLIEVFKTMIELLDIKVEKDWRDLIREDYTKDK